jgi:glucokinase
MNEPYHRLTLGVDLGGTKIMTAVVDSQGTMLSHEKHTTPAAQGKDAVIQAIVESVHQVIARTGIEIADLTAIGIGVPGPSNPQTGILFSAPNLPGWHDVPIRDILADEVGKRTFLINDANAAALAEFLFGAGRGSGCFTHVALGTGIGGGFVIDGNVYSGAQGTAAEFGHMTIDESKGPVCSCGNNGCWEALASGTALANEARRRIDNGEQTTLLNIVEGDLKKITAPVIHEAAQAGDPLAEKLLLRTSRYLGIGLANLINIINPDVIAIGGGLANMGDILLEPAYAVAKARAFAPAYEAVSFAPAELGGHSGVIGAAAYALQEADA